MDKKIKVPCSIYSRVVGYYQPINQWNRGKKEEFSERKTYCLTERQKEVINGRNLG